jgi:translocation and assembly module TamB
MEGTIEGKSLTLRVPANGVALVDGELRATLKDDRLVVHGLRFKGGDGFVTVQGEVGAGKGTTAKLQLNAKRLTLLNRRDAQLELDAAADVVTSEGAIHIQGGAQVVRAHFELLRSASMPTLADDIRIKNAAPAPASRQPLRLSVDLTTDFGDRFEVEASNFGPGSGSALKQLSGDFKARIEGRIHTRSDAKQIPQTTGNLNVVDGSYTAFGRNFRVQRGNLKFSGPLANPALDLFVAPVHGRIHLAPEVGISVTGTARAPRVRLVSQPEMPDGLFRGQRHEPGVEPRYRVWLAVVPESLRGVRTERHRDLERRAYLQSADGSNRRPGRRGRRELALSALYVHIRISPPD